MKTTTYNADSAEKQHILKRLSDIVGSRTGVLFAYVYGSFTGTLPFHDIDVAVYLSDAREANVALETQDLSASISDELKIPVDVRVLNYAPIPFRYHAIRGLLIFEKDQDRSSRFIEETIQRYLDIKPLLLAGTKEAFAA